MGTISGDGRAMAGLGGSAGYGEVQLPRSDDGSLRIDASAIFEAGLNYFGQMIPATDIWVNTNGTLSLGGPFPDYPTDGNTAALVNLIAVFWADVDTRLRGEGVESGVIHVDLDVTGDCLTITWDMVGVYRRDTATPNRFQIQIHDRGNGDFDIVLRYEVIAWTIGTAPGDTGARAQIMAANGTVVPVLPGTTGEGLAPLDTSAGNTGITGLWVWRMRGGVLLPGLESGAGPDSLTGTDNADTIRSGGGNDTIDGLAGNDSLFGEADDDLIFGGTGRDSLQGGDGHDRLYGGPDADVLRGEAGNDTLAGDDGADTLDGGDGNDSLTGGPDSTADLRDVIYGGAGDDRISGGGGNDSASGGTGNDTLDGGPGADTLIGNDGNDVLSGGAGSDEMSGNAGDDWLNGGFGHDRMNGGAGADSFYHLGISDHGSDWIQDYSAAAGDRLIFGQAGARIEQFQVNYAHTADAQGIRSGDASIAEAFVIYRPTGQIIWALVDGAAQTDIVIVLNGQSYDLVP